MHVFAVRSVRAKTGNVIRAQHSAYMPVSAVRPVPAKSAIVPRAILYLALGVYVQERTLFVVTGVETGVEVTLGHFGHVIFVQEFALVAFFAQTAKPMFTDDGSVAADVSEWAERAFLAASW